MRFLVLYTVIGSLLLLWSGGCSYSVDRSKICRDGDAGITEEGSGKTCTADEQCAGNPISDGGTGATQCSTLDKLVSTEIPDGGVPADGGATQSDGTGDTGSEFDDFMDMLSPMVNICTNMACEPGACPMCYQCCACDMPVSEIMELYGVSAGDMDPTLEYTRLDFTACVPVSVAEALAFICSCN